MAPNSLSVTMAGPPESTLTRPDAAVAATPRSVPRTPMSKSGVSILKLSGRLAAIFPVIARKRPTADLTVMAFASGGLSYV